MQNSNKTKLAEYSYIKYSLQLFTIRLILTILTESNYFGDVLIKPYLHRFEVLGLNV